MLTVGAPLGVLLGHKLMLGMNDGSSLGTMLGAEEGCLLTVGAPLGVLLGHKLVLGIDDG